MYSASFFSRLRAVFLAKTPSRVGSWRCSSSRETTRMARARRSNRRGRAALNELVAETRIRCGISAIGRGSNSKAAGAHPFGHGNSSATAAPGSDAAGGAGMRQPAISMIPPPSVQSSRMLQILPVRCFLIRLFFHLLCFPESFKASRASLCFSVTIY